MKMWKVGLPGCFVLGVLLSSVLCLTSAVQAQEPRAGVQKEAEAGVELAICPVKIKVESPHEKKIIGGWKQKDLSAYWNFTKDGQLIAYAFGSEATVSRYELDGNKLTMIYQPAGEKNTKQVSVFTITQLTDTVLVVVDAKGRQTELRKPASQD